MSTTKNDIEIRIGETWQRRITFTDKETGQPLPLTGHSFRMQGRESTGSGSTIFDLTDDPGGGIVVSATEGTVDFTLIVTAQDAGKVKSGVYDVRHTDAAGAVTFPLEGAFTLVQTVTRDEG